MATGGWGTFGGGGGGAWAGSDEKKRHDDDDIEASAPPPQPLYNPPPPVPAQQSFKGTGAFGAASSAYAAPATAYGTTNSFAEGPSTAGSLTIREADLKKKEAELAAKEKQLKQLEKMLVDNGALKKKNWPRCWPIVYHNIPDEIPEKSRRPVREAYLAWYGLVLCLAWNLFCNCVMLGYKDASQRVPSWFLAIIYFLLGVPLSFWLWYLRLYNGAKNDGTLGFLGFFLWFAIHTAFCIWAAVAFPFSANKWSFAGFMTAINAFDIGNFVGIIYIIGACLWTLEAVWSFWIIRDVYFYFRGQGGVKQVQQEAALTAFKASMNAPPAHARA